MNDKPCKYRNSAEGEVMVPYGRRIHLLTADPRLLKSLWRRLCSKQSCAYTVIEPSMAQLLA